MACPNEPGNAKNEAFRGVNPLLQCAQVLPIFRAFPEPL